MRERMNERACPSVRNTAGSERPFAFADNDHGLAFACLIAKQTTIAAVLDMVRGLHVTAKISAIYFRDDTLATKLAAFHFLGHGLAQLVEQYECGLIGQSKIA